METCTLTQDFLFFPLWTW